MTQTPRYNATIMRRLDLHDGLFMLWIAPDGGEFPPFTPGQFVNVGRIVEDGAQALVKRAYSIGSSARDLRQIELFVVHVDDGEFTSWLSAQGEGARVWLSPKAGGGFTLDGFTPGRDLVLVSTGTAIAPFVSMYRTFHDAPPWRRIVIINGARLASDLGYRAELEAAARSDPRLLYLPTVTREPAGSPWSGLRGRVHALLDPARFRALTGIELLPGHCHVYICGNPEMIEELEERLGMQGFRKHTRHHPGNLHLEKYWTD
jgi:ferredoxin--NADP+ reductase